MPINVGGFEVSWTSVTVAIYGIKYILYKVYTDIMHTFFVSMAIYDLEIIFDKFLIIDKS